MEWKSGSAAHDWESVAKRDNLNFLQTELLNLEQAIHDIHIELQRIRRKEEEMRDLNGADWSTLCMTWVVGPTQMELLRELLPFHCFYLFSQYRLHAESTNARVAWLSVGALFICLGLCGWQLSYLQKFFKRKKLL